MNRSCLFILLILASAPLAYPAPDAIGARVEQVAKSEHAGFTHGQTHALRVFLTNTGGEDKSGLKVNYYLFGKDLRGLTEVAVLHKGQVNADVKAHGTAMVETPAATVKYTEEHSEGPRKNMHKVEASGKKFTGYGVQIFDGDALTYEYFSTQNLKALTVVDKAAEGKK
jgi:hypothetical protein